MHISRLVAAIVVAALLLASIGALVTLATNVSRIAVLLVLAVVVLCTLAVSTFGLHSRRWLSNPYW